MTRKTPSNSPFRRSSEAVMRRLGRIAALCLAGVFATPATPVLAQDFGQVVSDILVVDRERLFQESTFGQALSHLLETERARLEAETQQIEADLEAEEQALTDARASLSNEDFRARADVFDAKVRELRQQRDKAQEDLVAQIEKTRRAFLVAINPILIDLMRDAGASILLDRRSVLFSASRIDITDKAIALVDEKIGEGEGLDIGLPKDNTPEPEDAPDAPAAPGTDDQTDRSGN